MAIDTPRVAPVLKHLSKSRNEGFHTGKEHGEILTLTTESEVVTGIDDNEPRPEIQ